MKGKTGDRKKKGAEGRRTDKIMKSWPVPLVMLAARRIPD
jgi:hypothetical protein